MIQTANIVSPPNILQITNFVMKFSQNKTSCLPQTKMLQIFDQAQFNAHSVAVTIAESHHSNHTGNQLMKDECVLGQQSQHTIGSNNRLPGTHQNRPKCLSDESTTSSKNKAFVSPNTLIYRKPNPNLHPLAPHTLKYIKPKT